MDQVDKKKIMRNVFAMLKKQGKNSVAGVLSYLKENDTTEKIARQMLASVSDPKNIDYRKFAEVCGSVAKKKGLDLENISKNVAASLFGGVSAAPGGSSRTPATVGDASTSANINEYREDDDHDVHNDDHESSDNYHESSDNYHESSDNYHDSEDNYHDSDDNNHDSEDDHD